MAHDSAESESASSTSGATFFSIDFTKLILVRSAESGLRRSCASSERSSDRWSASNWLTRSLPHYCQLTLGSIAFRRDANLGHKPGQIPRLWPESGENQ